MRIWRRGMPVVALARTLIVEHARLGVDSKVQKVFNLLLREALAVGRQQRTDLVRLDVPFVLGIESPESAQQLLLRVTGVLIFKHDPLHHTLEALKGDETGGLLLLTLRDHVAQLDLRRVDAQVPHDRADLSDVAHALLFGIEERKTLLDGPEDLALARNLWIEAIGQSVRCHRSMRALPGGPCRQAGGPARTPFANCNRAVPSDQSLFCTGIAPPPRAHHTTVSKYGSAETDFAGIAPGPCSMLLWPCPLAPWASWRSDADGRRLGGSAAAARRSRPFALDVYGPTLEVR